MIKKSMKSPLDTTDSRYPKSLTTKTELDSRFRDVNPVMFDNREGMFGILLQELGC